MDDITRTTFREDWTVSKSGELASLTEDEVLFFDAFMNYLVNQHL